ncbi:hypothetical protein DZA07_19750 [Pseudomonas aeruginosa]|nr:hypothetical protein EIP87_19600 [Pseudomonas aeruginosa]MCO2346208.1 hypothetical protein [Pseudomonas aeruginosa]MCO2738592.1 hypothetical protein [Pseudomonas aeruginosa]MDV6803947.1 hypothetical protein [Pseudomonas aeruginosa]RSD06252.1 hypothetical protein EGT57_28800 [Pseudomonas aeruginosa]
MWGTCRTLLSLVPGSRRRFWQANRICRAASSGTSLQAWLAVTRSRCNVSGPSSPFAP